MTYMMDVRWEKQNHHGHESTPISVLSQSEEPKLIGDQSICIQLFVLNTQVGTCFPSRNVSKSVCLVVCSILPINSMSRQFLPFLNRNIYLGGDYWTETSIKWEACQLAGKRLFFELKSIGVRQVANIASSPSSSIILRPPVKPLAHLI